MCGVSKMVFSDEQCCFIIEAYFMNNKSFKTVRDVFRAKYGHDYSLPDSSINRVVRHFQHEHTILRKNGSGRPSTITTHKRNEVKAIVDAMPRVSVRRLAPRVQLSKTTTHRVLRKLKLKPYHISVQHELLPTGYEK